MSVTGATGSVGGRPVPTLLERGHEVVALVREPAGYDAPRGVTVAETDLLGPDTLDGPLADVDAASIATLRLRTPNAEEVTPS